MRKTIGVLFYKYINFDKRKKAFKVEKTEKAFIILSEIAKKKGFDVVFSDTFHYSKGKFKKAFIYDNGWKIIEDVKIDAIFDRCKTDDKTIKFKRKLSKEIFLYNSLELNRFCWDKASYSSVFKESTPQIFVVNDINELKEKLKEIRSSKYVLKPRFGICGVNIEILDKDKLPKEVRKNTVLQEFIDTSKGIPELKIKGVHDIRVVIIDNEIDHVYVRIPEKGLLSNIAQGGKAIHFDKKEIPSNVLNLVKIAQEKMKNYKYNLYTVDSVFGADGKPYVIEMESIPVIDSAYLEEDTKKLQKEFLGKIVDSIIASIK